MALRLFKKKAITASVTALILGLGLAGCGEGTDEDEDPATIATAIGGNNAGDTGTTISADGLAASNALTLAVPSSLSLSAFPKATGTSLALTADTDKTSKEKKDENEAILKGDADRCLKKGLFGGPGRNQATVTCYQFDSDMNPSDFGQEGRTFGTVDGTNGAGEACMVTFAREEVKDAEVAIDKALGLVNALMCEAKKAGEASLPEAGEEMDYTELFAAAMPAAARVTITKAIVARSATDEGERPVYITTIKATEKTSDTATKGREIALRLINTPGESEDQSSGVLNYLFQHEAQAAPGGQPPPAQLALTEGQVDPNNTENKFGLLSITFDRGLDDAAAPYINFLAERAAIVNTIEPFDASGRINFAALDDNAANSDVHAINFVAGKMNPETSEGKLSYWMNPGGSLNESARGFLFELSEASDGVLKGCGVSGATANVSIRKHLADSTNELAPVRFWHPKPGPNQSADKDDRYVGDEGAFVTEQCFKQNADGLYAIDTDVTTHARGYDVKAVAEVSVTGPPPPGKQIKGRFKEAKEIEAPAE